MNKDFDAKLKLLIKSEKALLALEMKRKSHQTFWIALAILALLVSLIMLNITLYFYFSTMFSDFQSAAILSGLNILIAMLFFFIALHQKRSAEADAIEDIRDFAWEQFATDIDEVKQNVADFKQSVSKVKTTVDSFTSGDAFGLRKILPVITTLIELNKKK